jgi:hypothetical protein
MRPAQAQVRTAWNNILCRTLSTTHVPLEKELILYSNKKQTPVSLRTLMETGRGDTLNRFDEIMKGKYSINPVPKVSQRILIQVACFLHRELPVRLAHRAMRFEQSPLFLRSGKFFVNRFYRKF